MSFLQTLKLSGSLNCVRWIGRHWGRERRTLQLMLKRFMCTVRPLPPGAQPSPDLEETIIPSWPTPWVALFFLFLQDTLCIYSCDFTWKNNKNWRVWFALCQMLFVISTFKGHHHVIKDMEMDEVPFPRAETRLLDNWEVSYQVYRIYFGAISWTHELTAAFAYSSATATNLFLIKEVSCFLSYFFLPV